MLTLIELVRAAAFVGLWGAGDRLLHGAQVGDPSMRTGLILAMVCFVVAELLRAFRRPVAASAESSDTACAALIFTLPLTILLFFAVAVGIEALRGTFSEHGAGTAFLAALWGAAALSAFIFGSDRLSRILHSKSKSGAQG
jgi:hypothetical protein